MELKDIAETLREQGEAFNAFKSANDALIKAKAEGKAVADLEAKVATLSEALDKLSDAKAAIEELQKKANRPQTDSEVKSAADLAAEVKGFNIALRAEYQAKGKPFPGEMDAKAYEQYKTAFFKVVAGAGLDNLSSDERKAMSAGSDPDGGYLLPPSTVGRMVSKLYEQSTMRQLATVQTISTDKLEGIVDNNEADAGWVSELGTRSDTDPPAGGQVAQSRRTKCTPCPRFRSASSMTRPPTWKRGCLARSLTSSPVSKARRSGPARVSANPRAWPPMTPPRRLTRAALGARSNTW